MAVEVEVFHIAFHPYVIDETIGVEFELAEPERIYLHLFVKQRFQLYVNIEFGYIDDGVSQTWDGVIVLDGLEVVDGKVERELE